MIAVAALYEAARGLSGVGFATATVAGLSADAAVRMCFATWDPVWRGGVGPWLACLAFVGLGAAALYRNMSSPPITAPGISWRDALGGAAFGPFLALQVLVLSSPAFVASSGWLSLTAAHVTIVIGQGLALAFLASGLAVAAVPGGVCVLGGTVLGIGAGAVAGRTRSPASRSCPSWSSGRCCRRGCWPWRSGRRCAAPGRAGRSGGSTSAPRSAAC